MEGIDMEMKVTSTYSSIWQSKHRTIVGHLEQNTMSNELEYRVYYSLLQAVEEYMVKHKISFEPSVKTEQ